MKFLVPFLGKTRASWIDAGLRDYAARINRYAVLELPVVKEHLTHGDMARTMARQAEELLSFCGPGRFAVALDQRGNTPGSEELASLLERWELRGQAELVFLIGGHAGLHASVLKRADFLLALSSLTFPHEIARLLLLEQLYRACTIKAGHPYHL